MRVLRWGMASTSTPIIVVHYQDERGYHCCLLLRDPEEGDQMEIRQDGVWMRVPVMELGELDGREILYELTAVARAMHGVNPTQDAEGRWVYGEAPNGGE